MMVFGGFVIGAGVGAFKARRRKGKPLDIAQYAAAHGILFAIVTLFVNVLIVRLL